LHTWVRTSVRLCGAFLICSFFFFKTRILGAFKVKGSKELKELRRNIEAEERMCSVVKPTKELCKPTSAIASVGLGARHRPLRLLGGPTDPPYEYALEPSTYDGALQWTRAPTKAPARRTLHIYHAILALGSRACLVYYIADVTA
jgi:hypothetical protein